MEDEIEDLRSGDADGDFDFSYSLWHDRYNIEIFEELGLDNGDYLSYPALSTNDHTGEPQTGWS